MTIGVFFLGHSPKPNMSVALLWCICFDNVVLHEAISCTRRFKYERYEVERSPEQFAVASTAQGSSKDDAPSHTSSLFQ